MYVTTKAHDKRINALLHRSLGIFQIAITLGVHVASLALINSDQSVIQGLVGGLLLQMALAAAGFYGAYQLHVQGEKYSFFQHGGTVASTLIFGALGAHSFILFPGSLLPIAFLVVGAALNVVINLVGMAFSCGHD